MSHGSSATGLRLAETLITWANVNWSARMITTRGKGGRIISTPITDEVAAILKPLVGHDPEAVFTYVSRRPKSGQHKGERQALTYAGVKSEWRAMLLRSGVVGFRLHDLRHDMASKLLRATGNIKLVSRALNHADLKSTTRYAHTADSEVAEAFQNLALARKKSHEKSHAFKPKSAQEVAITR